MPTLPPHSRRCCSSLQLTRTHHATSQRREGMQKLEGSRGRTQRRLSSGWSLTTFGVVEWNCARVAALASHIEQAAANGLPAPQLGSAELKVSPTPQPASTQTRPREPDSTRGTTRDTRGGNSGITRCRQLPCVSPGEFLGRQFSFHSIVRAAPLLILASASHTLGAPPDPYSLRLRTRTPSPPRDASAQGS